MVPSVARSTVPWWFLICPAALGALVLCAGALLAVRAITYRALPTREPEPCVSA